MIFDEVESLAQNRATTCTGNQHLATAMTNQLLQELNDHDRAAVFRTNHPNCIDTAIVRRCDIVAEIKPIPEKLEARASGFIL